MEENVIIYKKRRSKFTYKQKQNIIKEYESSGNNILAFAKKINVNYKTLNDWINNKNKIFSVDINQSSNIKLGCGHKPTLSLEIENEIFKYFKDVRNMGFPVTDELLKARGKFLLEKSSPNNNFSFSNGWLEKFKKRYNICNRKGGSTKVRNEDCDKNTILVFIDYIKKETQSGEYYAIINADETGTYYDSKINFTLDIKGTKRVEIKLSGREKQRITTVIGIDLLNNIKVKPLIILKGKSNRCLKNVTNNIDYDLSYQNNAWCTDDQFIIFLSQFPSDKKILLFFDNFSGHITKKVNDFIKDKLPLMITKTLPPNTTSILQPLDTNINGPFKAHIKKQYIDWLIMNFNEKKNIFDIGKKERTNLLLEWIHNSYNQINFESIRKAFIFCGYIEDPIIVPKWNDHYIVN